MDKTKSELNLKEKRHESNMAPPAEGACGGDWESTSGDLSGGRASPQRMLSKSNLTEGDSHSQHKWELGWK